MLESYGQTPLNYKCESLYACYKPLIESAFIANTLFCLSMPTVSSDNKSGKRFYAAAYQVEAEAARLYVANIQLSESLYPSLALTEVVLRNAVHRQLTYLYKTGDCYLLIGDQTNGLPELQPRIDKATEYIMKRKEQVSADKIVVELTFGF